MGNNKKGVQFFNDKDQLIILAKDNFSEQASMTSEILKQLQLDEVKHVRIHLSSKTKNFQSTYFKIRQTVIEQKLEDAKILVNSHPRFKQMILLNGIRSVATPAFSLESSSKELKVKLSEREKVFANSAEAKEIAGLIALDAPQVFNIYMAQAVDEKEEAFKKRARDLQHFFVQRLTPAFNVQHAVFYMKTKKQPHFQVASSYMRRAENMQLVEEQIMMPKIKAKHNKYAAFSTVKQIVNE